MPLKDPKNQKKIQDFLIEHAPLIGKVIGSLKKSGKIPSDSSDKDVHFAGLYGLMDAMHKYKPPTAPPKESPADPSENPFAKYAWWRISGKILDHVHGESKIPKPLKTRAKNLALLEQRQRSGEINPPEATPEATPETTEIKPPKP